MMRHCIINILFFFLPLLCWGQEYDDVFAIVENASISNKAQDIRNAYNAILWGRNIHSSSSKMDDIMNKLEADEIAIEFFELPKSSGGSNYLAFVLKRGMDAPRLYNICSSDELLYLLDSDCNFYNDTKVLSAITTPLAEEFKGVTTIYFVPAGKLHEIALEYCMDPNGKMFCENYNVYRLTSSTVLADKREHSEYKNFSIWGGIELEADLPYDDADGDMEPYRNTFEYLEDSYKAAEAITEELKEKGRNVTFCHNETATETSLKALSGKDVDVFLIETHGIFTKKCSISPKNGVGSTIRQSRPCIIWCGSRNGWWYRSTRI